MAPVMVPLEAQSRADLDLMDQAVLMAEEAMQAGEIPVGCVLARDGKVLARGRNRTNETRNACLHAEFDALHQLLPPRDPSSGSSKESDAYLRPPLRDLTLYVTVEPCIMCASALRQVEVGKVIYGCSNDRFGGCGGVVDAHKDPRLTAHPPFEAFGGYRREAAIMFLRRFYVTENVNAPAAVKRSKANRVVKDDIPPIPLSSLQALQQTDVP